MALNPSDFAVWASTDAAAYSRTKGRPISSPTSAMRKSPRLLSGCNQRSSTSSGTTYAATTSTANTTRLPTSRVCSGCLRTRMMIWMSRVMPKAMVTAVVNGMLPTRIQ